MSFLQLMSALLKYSFTCNRHTCFPYSVKNERYKKEKLLKITNQNRPTTVQLHRSDQIKMTVICNIFLFLSMCITKQLRKGWGVVGKCWTHRRVTRIFYIKVCESLGFPDIVRIFGLARIFIFKKCTWNWKLESGKTPWGIIYHMDIKSWSYLYF